MSRFLDIDLDGIFTISRENRIVADFFCLPRLVGMSPVGVYFRLSGSTANMFLAEGDLCFFAHGILPPVKYSNEEESSLGNAIVWQINKPDQYCRGTESVLFSSLDIAQPPSKVVDRFFLKGDEGVAGGSGGVATGYSGDITELSGLLEAIKQFRRTTHYFGKSKS